MPLYSVCYLKMFKPEQYWVYPLIPRARYKYKRSLYELPLANMNKNTIVLIHS